MHTKECLLKINLSLLRELFFEVLFQIQGGNNSNILKEGRKASVF